MTRPITIAYARLARNLTQRSRFALRRRELAAAAIVATLSCTGGGGDGPTAPPPRVRGITVTPATLSLVAGQQGQLSAAVTADAGVSTAYSWASTNASLVSVASSGQVTALGVTSGVSVCATATADATQSACAIVSAIAPVASVVVTAPAATMMVGATQQLAASTLDAGGAVLSGRVVTWNSSDVTKATVSASGVMSAVGAGSVTISATSEGKTGSVNVSVLAPVATVSVTPGTATLSPGTTQQLTANVLDASGAVLTGRAVAWTTSDAQKASVSANGLVTAVAPGAVTVTATSEGKAGSAAITVAVPVATVTVTPTTASLVVGTTRQLDAAVLDAVGNALANRQVNWSSSDPARAAVSATGLVTAVAAGSATISATSEGRSGSATIVVVPPVATITISPATATLSPGATQQLTATLRDDTGAALTGRTVTWTSSDASKASVSSSGLVTANAVGSAVVTATSEGRSATASIAVAAPVASVVVTPASTTLVPGATQQLTAAPRDASGATLSGRVIAWSSSDPSRATVSSTGLVTAVAQGTATVSATSEGHTGTATIVVNAPATSPCSQIRPIVLGQTVTGSIATTDCRLADGSFAQKWDFTLATATTVDIRMNSAAVDAYLIVVNDATGTVVAEDDDGGGGTNARIQRALLPGHYVVYANTFAPGQVGAYQLSVVPASAACINASPLGIPQTVAGTLGTSSCLLNDGSYANRYQLNVATRTTVQLDMTSTAIDPYLFLTSSAGAFIGGDDDSGEGMAARLVVTLEPGSYILYANSYAPGEVGSYQLSSKVWSDPCAVSRTIAVGGQMAGVLTASDCLLSTGQYDQRWLLTLTSATTVKVDMTSAAIDSYLVLQDASGAVLVEDDDSGDGLNARIQVTLPAGQYVINATSALSGEVGSYLLGVTNVVTAPNVSVSVSPPTATITAGQSTQLTATVTGSSNTAVAWSSSAPAIATVTATGVVRGIAAGSATIRATAAADPSKSAASVVTVTPLTSGINLDVAGMYLVQSIQSLDWSIPLVANRPAMARVFVRGSQAGLAAARVRVRLYSGGAVIGTYTGSATPTSTINEACCSADILLPASVIRSGVSVLADVDPDNQVTEANETDNQFPVSGTPRALGLMTVPDFNIRLVPVRQTKNGRLGTAGPTLLSMVNSVWPIGRMNVDYHAIFSTDVAPLVNDDANGSWSEILRQMDQLRRLEGSSAYYYGVVNVGYSSGIAGLGSIGGKSAIGVDWGGTVGSGVLAHELGHNFSRRHAPCGETYQPANVDPGYPFSDGHTGIFGMDMASSNRVISSTAKDLMSYCSNTWVSAYNYSAVASYRASTTGAIATTDSVTLISGMITQAGIRVDPAFSVIARPDPVEASGRYEATGVGEDGRILFRQRFQPLPVEDGDTLRQPFVVAVRMQRGSATRLARIEVRDLARPGLQATRARAAMAESRADLRDVTLETALSRGERTVHWNTAAHPAAVIRNHRTGEVLAIIEGGDAILPSALADDVDILLSDGVSSTMRTLSPDGRQVIR